MTNKQRLEEIEEQWSATRDLDKIWLITRVKKLTEALEIIAYGTILAISREPEDEYEAMEQLAQKALEESE